LVSRIEKYVEKAKEMKASWKQMDALESQLQKLETRRNAEKLFKDVALNNQISEL